MDMFTIGKGKVSTTDQIVTQESQKAIDGLNGLRTFVNYCSNRAAVLAGMPKILRQASVKDNDEILANAIRVIESLNRTVNDQADQIKKLKANNLQNCANCIHCEVCENFRERNRCDDDDYSPCEHWRGEE